MRRWNSVQIELASQRQPCSHFGVIFYFIIFKGLQLWLMKTKKINKKGEGLEKGHCFRKELPGLKSIN